MPTDLQPSRSRRSRFVAFLSALVIASLVPAVPASAAGGSFWDDDNSVHEAGIEAIYAAGITKGCGDGKFCPKDPVTREQMAAFLARALKGKVTTLGTPQTYSDLGGSEFKSAIAWLSAAGITQGCGGDRFCPEKPVTREQMAAFLKRALEGRVAATGAPRKFTDVGNSEFKSAIAWLSATGITQGCGTGKFCPRDPVTREQMATFLTRALGLKPIPPETVSPPPPPGSSGNHNGTTIANSQLLTGAAGTDKLQLTTKDFQGNPVGEPRDPALGPFPNIGTFRVFCNFSHQNFDDAIIFPGQARKSHLHSYFGNKNTNANSTAGTIAGGGKSTCQGGIADRSAYWIPSLYDKTTKKLIKPSLGAVYYQSAYGNGIDPASIQPVPKGLKMIAGSAAATPSAPTPDGYWGCFNNGPPTNTGKTIPDCPAGQSVTMIVNFPQCWDGVHLDSADHKSHMAFPSWNKGCPASHPVAIPRIMLQVIYPMESHGTGGWNLTSDNYSVSQRGGASIHADFVNGWDTQIMDRWLNKCIRAVKDCERGELGDGEALVFSFGGAQVASVSSSGTSAATWSQQLLEVSSPDPAAVGNSEVSVFCAISGHDEETGSA